MRSTFRSACLLIVGVSACAAGYAAETADVLQRSHAWARFDKGAWRHVRIITETFDQRGKVASSSVADNITTLDGVSPEGVTLKVNATVEVAGQKFPSTPHTITQGYAGEMIGHTVSITSLADEMVTVDGRAIPCRSQQIEILGAGNKEVIQINYAENATPAILRRRSTTSEAASGKTTGEAVTEVFALDKQLRLPGETRERRGYRVRQRLKTGNNTTITWSDHVFDVPGEIVGQMSQKFDERGHLIRRTTLELVDYGLREGESEASAPDEERSRRKQRRQRRGR